MVSNSGFLRLVFDFGFERQEIVYEKQNFLTGQFHDVKIERFDQGKLVRIEKVLLVIVQIIMEMIRKFDEIK